MSELRAFQNAILVRNVVARVSTDFSSPEAFRKYLKDHPNADKSKHHVVKDNGERGSAPAHTTKKLDKDLGDEIAKHWKGPSGNAVDKVRSMIEEGREVPENMIDKAVTVLHDQSNKPGLDKEKAKVLRSLRDKLKSRTASAEHESMVFPSEEALKTYLKEHPKADSKNHKVQKPKHDDKAAPADVAEVEQAAKGAKSKLDHLEKMLKDHHSKADSNYVVPLSQQMPGMVSEYKKSVEKMCSGVNAIPAGKDRDRAKKIVQQLDKTFEDLNKELGFRWETGSRRGPYLNPDQIERTVHTTKPLVEELDKLLTGQRTLLARVLIRKDMGKG